MSNLITGLDFVFDLVCKNISVVGKVRKHKRYISQEIHWEYDKKVDESVFDMSSHWLVIAKRKTVCYVLSSMHYTRP